VGKEEEENGEKGNYKGRKINECGEKRKKWKVFQDDWWKVFQDELTNIHPWIYHNHYHCFIALRSFFA